MGVKATAVSDYVTKPSYDGLFDAVQIYLNRFDIDTVNAIPFFINAAEKVILRTIRMPSLEKIVSFTLQNDGFPDEGYLLLPYDYIEMKHVWSNGSTLQRVPFDQLLRGPVQNTGPLVIPNPTTDQTYGSGSCNVNSSGMSPEEHFGWASGIWSIVSDRMYIKGIGATQEVFMTYYQDIPEIHRSQQTNPLLDLMPDVFLYLAVAEGWKFLMEFEKSQQWEISAAKRMAAIKSQVDKAEFAGSPLVIKPL
ncbi:hypothetical protein [Vibrio phage vB_VpaP_SJSY21]|nr:hypothetical protein [Vibrio phage vB_VpaP_SJSY21]